MSQRFSIWAAGVAVASALVTPTMVNSTAAAAPLCRTDSLSLSTGPYGAPGDNTQMHFAVILTNISPQSCMLRGYPGVDLVGPDGPTYSLPRQSGDPQPLTLAPGASASSRLTFLPTPTAGCLAPSW